MVKFQKTLTDAHAPLQTLRVTPAMQAGLTDRVWEIADLIRLLDAADKKAA